MSVKASLKLITKETAKAGKQMNTLEKTLWIIIVLLVIGVWARACHDYLHMYYGPKIQPSEFVITHDWKGFHITTKATPKGVKG